MFGRFRFGKENPEVYEVFVRVEEEAQNMTWNKSNLSQTQTTGHTSSVQSIFEEARKTEPSKTPPSFCKVENPEIFETDM